MEQEERDPAIRKITRAREPITSRRWLCCRKKLAAIAPTSFVSFTAFPALAAAVLPLTEEAAAVPTDACPALIAAYSFLTACLCRQREMGFAAACGFSAIRFL